MDGHHEKLKKQSAPIPDYFARFTRYNLPQLSKHRKRQSTNLSSSMLKSLSSLFQNLQASFWSNTSFKCLHQHTEILAQTLASYSDYLSSQHKVMKTLHAQQVPARQLSDALSIRYIYACTANTLIDAADKKEDFKHLL